MGPVKSVNVYERTTWSHEVGYFQASLMWSSRQPQSERAWISELKANEQYVHDQELSIK
jgi:hypothetical protein